MRARRLSSPAATSCCCALPAAAATASLQSATRVPENATANWVMQERWTEMYVVERFARYAVETRSQPIAPEALHHAKRAVIDWYAAVFPGGIVAPATLLEKALAEDLVRGKARLALGRK